MQAESDRLLELTEADPELPVRRQLLAGLDSYLGYVETHQYGYRALHRGAAAADERIRAIVEHGLAEQERRILARLGADGRPAETLRIAVRGRLAFVVAVCLDWLERRSITRAQLRDLCAQAWSASASNHGKTTARCGEVDRTGRRPARPKPCRRRHGSWRA